METSTEKIAIVYVDTEEEVNEIKKLLNVPIFYLHTGGSAVLTLEDGEFKSHIEGEDINLTDCTIYSYSDFLVKYASYSKDVVQGITVKYNDRGFVTENAVVGAVIKLLEVLTNKPEVNLEEGAKVSKFTTDKKFRSCGFVYNNLGNFVSTVYAKNECKLRKKFKASRYKGCTMRIHTYTSTKVSNIK